MLASRPPFPLLLACLLLATPFAAAGTPESPELSDEVGDCAFAPGNEYADIASAWVSDETATDFTVNLALSKWEAHAGHAAGYTVQFVHQGVQWGVAAFYDALQGAWFFSTARITEDEMTGWNDTTGSFADGGPAVISVQFPKDLFPHTQAMDHTLRDFTAISVDIKGGYGPGFARAFGAPVPYTSAEMQVCDEAVGDGVYVFQVGEHSMEDMGDMEENATLDEDVPEMDAENDMNSTAATPEDGPAAERESPAPALLLVLLVAAGVAAGRRRLP